MALLTVTTQAGSSGKVGESIRNVSVVPDTSTDPPGSRTPAPWIAEVPSEAPTITGSPALRPVARAASASTDPAIWVGALTSGSRSARSSSAAMMSSSGLPVRTLPRNE